MGSSSGEWSSPSQSRVDDLVERKRSSAEAAAYDVEVNSLLEDSLRKLNDRDVAAVRGHLNGVKLALEAEGIGTIDLLFGGSVSKHTYVDGLSDVDVLAIVSASSSVIEPQQLIQTFANRLRSRFPGIDVTTGRLAVTVRYRDGVELQILPAVKTPMGIRIASSMRDGWSHVIRPEAFARKLTSLNQSHQGRVVPAIKLFKALIESASDGLSLSGYHVESLAIEAFEGYSGRPTRKAMLYHLVSRASDLVRVPIKDRTGQSLHVDDYLGDLGSRQRANASARLHRLAKRIEAADRDGDLSAWREMLTDE